MSIYILRANLPLSYTLTGNNRDAFTILSSSSKISLKAMDSVKGGDTVKLPKESFWIHRARIIPSGAEGCAAPKGKNAADIILSTSNENGDSVPFKLCFSKWDEWEGKNILLTCDADSELKVMKDSIIRSDDFNLVDAYVGQSFDAVLEIEIEASSLA